MVKESQDTVTARVAGFSRYLNQQSFTTGTLEIADMLRSLELGGSTHPETGFYSFRSICCKTPGNWIAFEEYFKRYWYADQSQSGEKVAAMESRRAQGGLSGLAGTTNIFASLGEQDSGAMGAGRQTTISKADFRFLGDAAAMREVEQLAEGLARRIRLVSSRRQVPATRSGLLDLNRTTRNAVRHGGIPVSLRFKQLGKLPPRLVLLQDVSHSMTFNNPLLTRFARGIVRRFRSAEAFVFHTRLHRVTPWFRKLSLSALQLRLERKNDLWMGGTCIADSIEALRVEFGHSVCRRDAIVIIMSDGFDANDPRNLHHQLEQLKKSVRKVVWLNPMLGREGINANKPQLSDIRKRVDVMLPAHSLDSLQQCIRHV